MYRYIIIIAIFTLSIGAVLAQRKPDINKAETLYASSLFRMNQVLEGIPYLHVVENVSSVSTCLLNCMKRKPDCKSFNWGNGTCMLMSDSICFNETLLLTRKEGYAYYDIMDAPDSEKKHLKDGYCRLFGKCSAKCYPRSPHLSDTPMIKSEAKKYCESLGRTLPMPTNLDEQRFFEAFARKRLAEQPDLRTGKDTKFWMGISDELMEESWMYDDENPVSDKFSAWATGQPDNGGAYANSGENCGAISEKAEFKWADVNCNLKIRFFCA
ncbi:C-type lectin domain family 4 member E-like [Oppia nitens]|uniref:C-type lectin domain family 4 member E-like n=1 Tax=Oppia nitens TaxID=1686743 RepID=UPI0023D99537|nr:C-type lectin domain family 4 member E-like [Oppia nitens]